MDDAWDALRERRSVLVLCAVVRAQDVQLQRVHSGRHAPMVDEFVCVCVFFWVVCAAPGAHCALRGGESLVARIGRGLTIERPPGAREVVLI